jgi:hypothetical protein
MLVAIACHDRRWSFWRPAHAPAAPTRADALLACFALAEQRARRVAELPQSDLNHSRGMVEREFVIERGANRVAMAAP